MKNMILVGFLVTAAFLTGCVQNKETIIAVGEGVHGTIEGNYAISNNYLSEKLTLNYTGEDELIAITFQADDPVILGVDFQGHIGTVDNQSGIFEGKKKHEFEEEEIIKAINQGNITVEWETTNEVHKETI